MLGRTAPHCRSGACLAEEELRHAQVRGVPGDVREGARDAGHGAEPTDATAKDEAKDGHEKSDHEAGAVMHVEFAKVLTVLLLIALLMAVWPMPPDQR